MAKEYLDQTLNSKIQFLKNQMTTEQHERNSMEEKLSLELEQLRVKLEDTKKEKKELEVVMERERDHKLQETQIRTQQIISALKTQVSFIYL